MAGRADAAGGERLEEEEIKEEREEEVEKKLDEGVEEE